MPTARRPSTRGLTLRSLLALAVLSLLALSNYAVMRDYTRAGDLHSAVINACGRQRMLVMRIGLLAQQLGLETDSEEKSILRGALRDAIQDMESSHAGLVHAEGPFAYPLALPDEARALFFEPPALLDRRLHGYLEDAKAWSNEPDQRLTPVQPLLRRLMAAAGEKTLLQSLEHVTQERQKDAESHLAGLKRRNGWVLGSTLTVLLLTALFVFRPTLRRLDREVREIEHSEAFSRAIVDTAVDGIIIIDEHGTIQSVNPAAQSMFGYDAAAMVGRNVKFLVPEPMRTEHDDYVRRYVETGHAKIIGIGREVVGRRNNGDLFPLDLAVSEMQPRGQRMFLGMLRDVSERHRAQEHAHHLEEQLRHSQKMEALGRLAGGIAHDFNNLMTTVTGYSELLLDRLGENDPLRKYVEEIKGDGERATALTRQLLALSRRQVAEPSEIELRSVVSNMENMLRRIIGEDVQLLTSFSADPGHIRADSGQVEQVVMNLVVNARDAMPQGGTLSVETRCVTLDAAYAAEHAGVRPGLYVMMAISDTGVGMTPEVQSHLFEPFFTTKERGKGTGLGLSIVYGIVKQYGGHIGVYSEPGRGTVFKLYWPEISPQPTAATPLLHGERRLTGDPQDGGSPPAGGSAPRRDAAGGQEPGAAEETILLVEDEHRVRGLAKEILERHGYRIIEASGPSEAQMRADEHPGTIHLLLTDVVMPQMNGRELAGRLAQKRPGLKILYMSGYTDDSVLGPYRDSTHRPRREAEGAIVQQGVLTAETPFIQKPFTSAGLTSKVREVLDSPP